MILYILVALVCTISADSDTPPLYDTSSSSLYKLFQSFKIEYSRSYSSIKEESMRYDTFINNIYIINEHNSKADINYILDITKFMDWTDDEFNKLNNLKTRKDIDDDNSASFSLSTLPSSIDWTTIQPSVVTPVKDQGNCGSCWAFGATGSWESRYAISNNKLNSLSEQELIDCVPGNNCILGGFSDDAFAYGIKANGDSLEADYPYKAKDGKCNAGNHTHYDPLSSITIIQRRNETAMMAALQTGPITVAVDAQGWNNYRSGVFDGKCGTNLDHNVMAVGYGIDSKSNMKYWKIKNSWGTSWGIDGYILLCRDCGKNGDAGECGVNLQPSYPVVVT